VSDAVEMDPNQSRELLGGGPILELTLWAWPPYSRVPAFPFFLSEMDPSSEMRYNPKGMKASMKNGLFTFDVLLWGSPGRAKMIDTLLRYNPIFSKP
jgi:hypothetical protein